ncbi:MAG: enoyl-CoA hydratase/isomerase family protein, partial [bacterium]
MSAETGEVRFEIKEKVGVITISNPDRLNVLSTRVLGELKESIFRIETQDEVRVVVIHGEGEKAMAAGADLNMIVDMGPVEAREFSRYVQDMLTKIESLPVPVIAAVSGFALGGGLELALACDLIFAAENARLGLPETNLGIIPGWGGSIRLPRRVGLGRAKEMIFSGRLVEAAEAHAIGLADAVFPLERFMDEVMSYAGMLTKKSRYSLALAKSTVLRGMDASLEA